MRREREANEIERREMAKKTGVSPAYLSKVERDKFLRPAQDKTSFATAQRPGFSVAPISICCRVRGQIAYAAGCGGSCSPLGPR